MGGIRYAKHNAAMQQARTVGQVLFAWATDHDNAYPEGKSSTEIFQKMIDDGYAMDAGIFYLPLAGKVRPVPGQKLKPENVCWDVTAGSDFSSSGDVPLVFMTGYKITYAAGAAAVPVIQPYPAYWSGRTWSEWWDNSAPAPDRGAPGMAVFYKGNNAVYFKPAPDNSVPNVVPPDFKPDGKTYRQLTPEGELK